MKIESFSLLSIANGFLLCENIVFLWFQYPNFLFHNVLIAFFALFWFSTGQVFLQTLTRPQLLKTQSKSTRFDDTNQGTYRPDEEGKGRGGATALDPESHRKPGEIWDKLLLLLFFKHLREMITSKGAPWHICPLGRTWLSTPLGTMA